MSVLFAAVFLSSAATPQIRIDAGGVGSGAFLADTDFSGGTVATSTNAIAFPAAVLNPVPTEVYQTERWSAFTYTVPGLIGGQAYTVRLHFAEVYWTAVGQRELNVPINGTQVPTNFDIVKAA
jgi:hypothetical protein